MFNSHSPSRRPTSWKTAWVVLPFLLPGCRLDFVGPVDTAVASLALAAAGPVVNTTEDDGDGTCTAVKCTLRDAIATASAGDQITFDPALDGMTIVLAGAALVIDKSLTITGPGPSVLAVSANGQSRVFRIDAGVMATISGLAITGGRIAGSAFGAGISNDGTAVLRDVTVHDNTAEHSGGGLRNGRTGNLTIENSTIRDNHTVEFDGGGVSNAGVLIVDRTTIRNNDARVGGGIYSLNFAGVDLTVRNSTISGNHASGEGGGITNARTARIETSTISGNTSVGFGAGISNSGILTIESSTITRNGSTSDFSVLNQGIGEITLRATILAGNSGGVDCLDRTGGGFTSEGYNLTTGALSSCPGSGPQDRTVQPDNLFVFVLDLDLADNSGSTLTHALLDPAQTGGVNLALDNGSCSPGVTTDQRGFVRPVDLDDAVYPDADDACDIGAVEFGSAPPPNQPPVAHAGDDQTVAAPTAAGAQVTLDGSQSSDRDGDALSFSWTEGAAEIASGEMASVFLAVGIHQIQLTVSDGLLSDSDDVAITVTCAPNTLYATIEAWREAGTLDAGQATALSRHVEQYERLMARGKQAEAEEKLRELIQQAQDLAAEEVLTARQVEDLTACSEWILAA